MDYDQIKESIGRLAAQLVQSGMTIGLGSGTTSKAFVAALIERVQAENLSIQCVATSKATEEQAKKGGLSLIQDFLSPFVLDMSFDGADWVDPNKNLIKGFGGALLREKIVAYASKKFIVMVDDRKLCPSFALKKLPIEIIPFGFGTTISRIPLSGSLRKNYITDNGNYIFDAEIPENVDIFDLERHIRSNPGVVETGLFTNISPTVLVGKQDGTIETW